MEKWNIALVLYVGALYDAVFCSPPRPEDVFFYSINLQNVLHWQPGENTPPNTYFTVQYAIYGDRERSSRGGLHWRIAPRCRDVEMTRCDLTNQTSDLEQGYYARVRAVGQSGLSKWKVTGERFDPKSDTVVGPPLVTLEMEENSVNISITAPMRYQPDSHKPEMSMLEVYPQMTYTLSIHIADGNNLTNHIPLSSSRYVSRRMVYDTEYCFSAQARFSSMPIQCQPSAWHCIHTPQDPWISQLRRVIVGIVVPTLCICMLGVGGYLTHYLVWGKEEKRPDALEVTCHHCSPLTFSPENVDLIIVDAHAYDYKLLPDGKTWPPEDVHPCKPQPPIGALPDQLSYAPQCPLTSPEPDTPWESGHDSGGEAYGGLLVIDGQENLEEPRQGLGNGDEEEGRGRREEEEEDTGRIHWDPESRVLILKYTHI